MRQDNPKKSKLLRGLEKVIDRQNKKSECVKIDIGMNTYKEYNNRSVYAISKLSDFYFPLLWQPLKYAIKRTAHTVYTYSLSPLPHAMAIKKSIKRRHEARKSKEVQAAQ